MAERLKAAAKVARGVTVMRTERQITHEQAVDIKRNVNEALRSGTLIVGPDFDPVMVNGVPVQRVKAPEPAQADYAPRGPLGPVLFILALAMIAVALIVALWVIA